MLTEATRKNIERKSKIIDPVQYYDGVPLPVWIEISPTELCNRECVFCPRVDRDVYPNQKLHMERKLADKIADDLALIRFSGSVVFCGYSEPLLHPDLPGLIEAFALRGIRTEIVTNGDKITVSVLQKLYARGLNFMAVSMYDGPHQIEKFEAIFGEIAALPDEYVLRDRWYDADKDFGLKLTNRAGTLDVGNQDPVDVTRACFYPSYQVMLDWNGDYLLCPQDWHKRVKFGNVATQNLFEIWKSVSLHKRRMQLIGGRRCVAPCNNCNANGQIHGIEHAEAWQK